MTTGDYLLIFCKIFGSLALLIYGMKVMSEALQKMAGSQLRHILGAMTTNRLTGMFTDENPRDLRHTGFDAL